MPNEVYDPFDPDESQQLLGHYRGTVLESFWSTDRVQSKGKANYDGADTTKLFWLTSIDEVLQYGYNKLVPEANTIKFGVGEKWIPNEDGTRIEHEDAASDEEIAAGNAKPVPFGGGSLYGKFLGLVNNKYTSYFTDSPVDPMVDEPKVLDDGPEPEYQLYGARAKLQQLGRNDPREAGIWVGFQWEFRGLGFWYRSTKRPGFGVVPVTYVGFNEDTPSVAPGAPEQAGSVVDAADVAARLPGDTEPGLVEQLAKLVSVSASHTEFMKQALVITEVKGDDAIKAAVMDSENGPWATK